MWGSLGMNLDQRGKCVCGGCRVPVLGGPDTFSFLASASHPWVQPACQSLGSTRRVSSRGWKHTHRSPRRAKSQGFLQEERKLEQEEEPPEAGEPQGPARQQGRPAGQQGVQRGRCCHFPSPGDLPHPGIVAASPALAGKFFTTCSTWEALVGTAEGNNWCTYVGPIRGIIKMQKSKRDGKAP